ncbi:hypothetical protein AUR64_04080 [Haloprofundus marisrubri]|uniref:Pentapeptide repeat-containing protein n=2 Tax=Haloprofundus marisrubri TaxID=1514971 RepID=A0A0W1RDF6_9EURY|nr:hypothetical protein AUR64_04080 [Haloprofundus marisrubri]
MFNEVRFRDEAKFSEATFVGKFKASDTDFERQATFHEVTFGDRADFSRSTFGGTTNFRRATFTEKASFFAIQADDFLGFHDVTFADRISLYGATLDHTTYFRETTFYGPANFQRTTFGKKGVYFRGAHFHEQADFSQSSFGGRIFFDADEQRQSTQFEDDLLFTQATFRDDVSLVGVSVAGVARFDQASWHGMATFGTTPTVERSEDTTTFAGPLVIDRGKFHHDLELNGVECVDMVSGESLRVHGEADLTGAQFIEGATFADGEFTSLTLDKVQCHENPVVKLSGADVRRGSIQQVAPHTPLYDFTDARIGDVAVTGTEETAPVFETLLIDNTRFDGFEFIRARRHIPDSWKLHQIGNRFDDVVTPSLSAEQKESVYRNAKNGADAVSDSTASAKFFQHEMRYKRDALLETTPTDTPLRLRLENIGARIQNQLFQFTTGYGERTRRVIGTALCLIFILFPLLYGLTDSLSSTELPSIYQGPAGYIELSLSAFAGISPRVPIDPPVRYLLYVESLVGTLVVAMLVLTLTRSVYR